MISPYVRRLRLATELRNLRAQAGVTHAELARRIGESRSQISRLENARAVDQKDIIKILGTLEVDGHRWEQIMAIAFEAAGRGWWETHRNMSDRQALHADLEAGAKSIREFQMTFVPGLLQTPEYTRARVESDRATQGLMLAPDDVVSACQLRQRMVRRSRGPSYDVVLDAVTVTRLAVPSEVAKAQLYSISATVNLNQRYTIQVLPTDAVIADYSMPRSTFSIFTFHDPEDPTIVVVDTVTEDVVVTDPTDVQRYEDLFDRLTEASMSPEASLDFLSATAATRP